MAYPRLGELVRAPCSTSGRLLCPAPTRLVRRPQRAAQAAAQEVSSLPPLPAAVPPRFSLPALVRVLRAPAGAIGASSSAADARNCLLWWRLHPQAIARIWPGGERSPCRLRPHTLRAARGAAQAQPSLQPPRPQAHQAAGAQHRGSQGAGVWVAWRWAAAPPAAAADRAARVPARRRCRRVKVTVPHPRLLRTNQTDAAGDL